MDANATGQMNSPYNDLANVQSDYRFFANNTFEGLKITSIETQTDKTIINIQELPKYNINVEFLDKSGNGVAPTITT